MHGRNNHKENKNNKKFRKKFVTLIIGKKLIPLIYKDFIFTNKEAINNTIELGVKIINNSQRETTSEIISMNILKYF